MSTKHAAIVGELLLRLSHAYPGATVGETMTRAGISPLDYPQDPLDFSDLDVQRLRGAVDAALARRGDTTR
jgi:hypothetical protein